MGLYALVAIGLTLLMGFAGQVSLGQGGFFLIGAYTSGLLTVGLDPDKRLVDPNAGIDPLLAVAAAPLVSAVALVIGVPLMRLRGHYLAFATLAFALIAWSLLSMRRTASPAASTASPSRSASRSSATTSPARLMLPWCGGSSGSRAAVDEPRRFTGGPSAAGDRRERARRCRVGVNVAVYKLQLFVFAAALAGLAGGLFTFYAQFLGPEDFVIVLSLFFVVMVSAGSGASTAPWWVRSRSSTSSTSCVSSARTRPFSGGTSRHRAVDPLSGRLRAPAHRDHALLPARAAAGIAGVVSGMRRRLTRRSTS